MLLIGPFKQVLPLTGLPAKGAIPDEALQVTENAGVVVDGKRLVAVGPFKRLKELYPAAELQFIEDDRVLLPGFIDAHTHICFDGSRSRDYAMRIAGKSYLEIARAGGGIWDSVTKTRAASLDRLVELTVERANRHLTEGVTTIEVKSGYGLSGRDELKMLEAIAQANDLTVATLIPTCLAAHMKPRDYEGEAGAYLDWVLQELVPQIAGKQWAQRFDIFIEDTAFDTTVALPFLQQLKSRGFDLTVHADQFTAGGSKVAVEVGAVSADHLEASREEEIALLAASNTVATVLPGASLGLGMPYAPARKLLDAGACLAIASDWNPGSAPMGDLLLQAAVMSAAEKLSTAEVFSGLTTRAAMALSLRQVGTLDIGMDADMQAYPCSDYRDILYYQGKMKPCKVWKQGRLVHT